MPKLIFIQDIDIKSSPMVRHSLRDDVVLEYANIYKADPKALPPVDLFTEDSKTYLIGDGMHRIEAVLLNVGKTITANIHSGGYEEALKYALRSNERHGIRRSQADKRKCVQEAIKQWPKLTDSAVGEIAGVDNHTVKTVRDGMETKGDVKPEPVREGSDGRKVSARKVLEAASGNSPQGKPASPTKLTDKDSTGMVMTAHALQFWHRTDEVKQLMSTLAHVSKELRAAQKNQDLMYAEVNFTAALADIDRLWANIGTAIPYAVCSTCQGQPKTQAGGCRLCKGRGIISKFRWETVPAEIRKMRSGK